MTADKAQGEGNRLLILAACLFSFALGMLACLAWIVFSHHYKP